MIVIDEHPRIPDISSDLLQSQKAYLQKDPSVDPISLLFEYSTEDDSHSIITSLNENRFFLPVLDDL